MGPYERFDLIRPGHRRLIFIGIGAVVLVIAIVGIILLLTGGETPTAEITASPTSAAVATLTPTPSPAGPPTETPTPSPTATLEPLEYRVQQGDTLVAILCSVGYCYREIIPTVVALNGMTGENQPLIPGTVLLIPRATPTAGPTPSPTGTPDAGASPQTAQPTVEGAAGGTAAADLSQCGVENPCVSEDGRFWIHTVREGETVAGLAFAYGTRVNAILEANGLPQDPLIFPGNQLLIPILVTLTPTLTPTGGPDSTATPLPTLSAPTLLAPANGATLARGQSVVLQWVADRPLAEGTYYLVVVRRTDTGAEHRATTQSSIYRLPADLQPGLGESLRYEWWVVVVSGPDPNAPMISGQGAASTFTWGTP
ncbi:MAG: hypothetical protein Kow00124_04380 [Anaerolineae bacterium]